MKSSKGFTLIELLVVIAIIGILSSVVLASLNSARAKGADAAVKSNLANIRAQAEIFYDGTGNSSYTGLCGDATIANMIAAAGKANGSWSGCTASTTNLPAQSWVASAALKNPTAPTGYWCVDSYGASKESTATTTSGQVKCN
ncbi:MAG: type II secretion system protein [Candidatus Paceibacterota bacterium]|jgi:prepilin-type N-terminal cleavage/methylation domain-containing protein